MKHFLTSILFFVSVYFMNAQSVIDSCGLDNHSKISAYEASFLNDYYRERNTFDFSDKTIAFITGGGGSIISSKSEYFNHVKQWKENHNTTIETKLVVLTDEEKRTSGGYDAIVLFWVKIFTKNQRAKMVVRLGATHQTAPME